MNMVIYYVVILDPRYKLKNIEFSFDTLYEDVTQCLLMKEKVKIGMVELFNTYKGMHESSGSSISSSSLSNPISSAKLACTTCLDMTSRTCMQERFQKFKTGGKSDVVKSELDKYLGEDLEVFQKEFDILNWWKVNSHRFPLLSKIAHDILAVPVSTVASESAFSTGGRVLDAFRSSLSPKIVQALICAQAWLRMDSKPINVEEDLCEIEIIERGDHILDRVENISPVVEMPLSLPDGYGSDHNWTKKSIVWDLLYWSTLLIQHNLDVMHIEKNVFDNIFNTVMDIKGKMKDNMNARRDLKIICNRLELELDERRPNVMPKAVYTLAKEQKRRVCEWIRVLKFHDESASNLEEGG
ncbi:Zinc finger BED domain-containing protein RICESLEEPER 1 [Sesamum angolense]|uniref:Zinc finger BED domain-containing protein RICESLEEPER 1 n=1 Tax=Sesamum angolense TaxID=2727404 RepID=A0AAE1WBL5_9LAMI|nr:Zinc finger BED domain-containing protein RICESLEEPER 1 [Sesamum angolense]